MAFSAFLRQTGLRKILRPSREQICIFSGADASPGTQHLELNLGLPSRKPCDIQVGIAILISSRGRCGCALPSQTRAVYGLDAGTEEEVQGWSPATQTDPANSLPTQLCVQTPGWLTYAWKGQSGHVVLACLAHPSFSPLPGLHRSL